MKTYKFILLIVALLLMFSISATSQCNSGDFISNWPTGTKSTTSNSYEVLSYCMYGGDYAICSVTSGETYEFTTCGENNFDTELTLFNGSNDAYISYNDDDCASQSTITWTATFTGTVKILLTEYTCFNNSTCQTVKWKCTTCAGNSAPDAPVLENYGGGAQLCFDNAYINDDTPTFRVSCSDPEGDDIDYRIEIDDNASFTSVDWTRDFDNSSSHYTSGSSYNLTCTSLSGIVDNTTYYVRIAAIDPSGANSYGSYSNTYSFTYKSSDLADWYQLTEKQLTQNTKTQAIISGVPSNNSFESGTFDNWTDWDLAPTDCGEIYKSTDYNTAGTYSAYIWMGTYGTYYDGDEIGLYQYMYFDYIDEIKFDCTTKEESSTPGWATAYFSIGFVDKWTDDINGTAADAHTDESIVTTNITGYKAIDIGIRFDHDDATGDFYERHAYFDNIRAYGTTSEVSSSIYYASFYNASSWDKVEWTTSGSSGSATLQVQYYNSGWYDVPDGALSGNSSGFTSSPIDISGLNTGTYSQLRLKVNYTYASNAQRKDLASWKVSVNYSDRDSEIEEPASQVAAGNINSIADTPGEAVDVFKFKITDQGSGDTDPTKVVTLKIKNAHPTNEADWTTNIQGVTLDDGAAVSISSTTITDEYIELTLDATELNVTDGTSSTVTMGVYLNTDGNVQDGKKLQFYIDSDDHGCHGDDSGSEFDIEFAANPDVESNEFTIVVTAIQLSYATGTPPAEVNIDTDFNVTVYATDVNDNIDIDNTCSVTLSNSTGSGTLSSVTGLTQSLVSGTYSWSDVQYDTGENNVNLNADGSACGLTDADQTFDCINLPDAFTMTAPIDAEGCTGSVSVTWNASTGATSYDVYYTTDGSKPDTSATKTAACTSCTSPYSFTASTAETTYRFMVKANNAVGSTWSTNVGSYETYNSNYWCGSVSSAWSNASNWCGSVPNSSTADIIIPAYPSNQPQLDGSYSVHNVTIESGASLDLNSNTLSVYGDWDNQSTIDMTTGTIELKTGNRTITMIDEDFSSGAISSSIFGVQPAGGFAPTSGYVQSDDQDDKMSSISMDMSDCDVGIDLSFRAKEDDGVNDKLLEVWNGSSWVVEQVISGGSWTTYEVSLDSYTNDDFKIRFDNSGANATFCVDDIELTCEQVDYTQTIEQAGGAFNNLTINKTNFTDTVQMENNLNFNGNLTITKGIFDANNYNIDIEGNWNNSSTFTPGTGTVTFSGTGAASITRQATEYITAYNWGFEFGTSGWTLPQGSNMYFKRTSGGANSSDYCLALYDALNTTEFSYPTTVGNYYVDAFTTVDLSDYYQAALQFYWKCDGYITTATGDRGNCIMDADYLTGTGTKAMGDQTSWTNSFYLADNATQQTYVDLSSYCDGEDEHVLRYRFVCQRQEGEDPGLSVDDIKILAKSQVENFYNVVFNKTGATVTLNNGVQALNDFTISSGTVDANGKKINCKADFINNGTFTHNNGTVMFSGREAQHIQGSSNTTFYNFRKKSSYDLRIDMDADKTIEVANEFIWDDYNDKLLVGYTNTNTLKINDELYINQGTTLETDNTSVVQVSGNYTDYGTHTYNDGKIEFYGTGQSIVVKEPATEIFTEDWEAGTTGWTLGSVGGSSEWVRSEGSQYEGSYDIAVEDDANGIPYDYLFSGTSGSIDLSKTLDLSSYSSATLTFWYRIGGDAGDYGQVILDDGVDEHIIANNIYNQMVYAQYPKIDLTSYCGDSYTLIFRFNWNNDSDGISPGFCIDDISVTNTSINVAPFNDMEIDKTGSGKVTLLGPIDVNDDLLFPDGEFDTGGNDFTVGGDWTNGSDVTYTHRDNTVTFDDDPNTNNGTVDIGTNTGGIAAFYNVDIQKNANTLTLSTNTFDVDNNLTITDGTLDADVNIEVGGNWTNNATFDPGTNEVEFDGTSTVTTGGTGAGKAFYDVELDGTSATLAGDINIDNDFTMTSGTWDVSGTDYDMYITGNFTKTGGTFNEQEGTVIFDGNANSEFISDFSGGTIEETELDEDFENGGSIPSGWSESYVTGSSENIDWQYVTNSSTSYPSADHSASGTYFALFKDGDNNQDKTKLITPSMDLSDGSNCELKFWHYMEDWSGDQDELRVYYKTSSGGTWTLLQAYTSTVESWTERTISLPNPSGDYYVAFEGMADYGYGVCIDDVTVTKEVATSSGEGFYDLTINKSASSNELELDANMAVANNVTMTTGKIDLNNKELQLGTTGTVVGETNDNRIFESQYQTQLGKITATRTLSSGANNDIGGLGISINAAGSAPGETVIEREHFQYTDIDGNGAATILREFNITPTTNSGLNATLRVEYFDDELAGQTPEENLKFWRYASGSWTEKAATVATPASNYVELSGIDAFSKWGPSAGVDPLPIELVYFKVVCNDRDGITLNWATQAEINNSYYTIQRSYDGINYESIATMPGQGNSNALVEYEYVDNDYQLTYPVYYRLQQTDFDGTVTTSHVESADCREPLQDRIVGYKVNKDQGTVTVFVDSDKETAYHVTLIDDRGRKVVNTQKTLQEGTDEIRLPINGLVVGIYVLMIQTDTDVYNYKLMIE